MAHSKETKDKIAKAHLGMKASPETILAIKKSHPKGMKVQNKESIEKIRARSLEPDNLAMLQSFIPLHKDKNYETQYGELRAKQIKDKQRLARLKWWRRYYEKQKERINPR